MLTHGFTKRRARPDGGTDLLRWAWIIACVSPWLAITPVAAQATAQRDVFPPVSDDLQGLWERIDSFATSGNMDAVIDGLLEFDRAIRRSDPGAVTWNGSKLSLGAHRVFSLYADRLADDPRRRLMAIVDARLESEWNTAAPDPFSESRARVRRRIVRDYPQSKYWLDALREDAEVAFLEGFWQRGLSLSMRLLREADSGRLTISDDERARWTSAVVDAARAVGDREASTEHRAALARLISSAALSEASRSLAQRIISGGECPVGTAGDRGRSSLRAGSDSADEPPRLGSVIWAATERDVELRRFVDQRTVGRDGSERPLAHVPLPYHPAVRDEVVVLQQRGRVTAYDLRTERERWTVAIDGDHDALTVPRAPLIGSRRVFVAGGSVLTAIDAETGERIWTRAVLHSRNDSRLLVSDGAVTPSSTEIGNESLIAPVTSIGPGVFVDGDIVHPVVKRLDREAQLYLLRCNTDGGEVWQRYLGSARSSNFLGLGAVMAAPVVADADLLVVTDHGFAASVDAIDGAIHWIAEYPRLTPRASREALRDELRWHAGNAVVFGELLLAAPQDSPFLLALDIASGAFVWRVPRRAHSTLVGCDAERAYLAGAEISAIGIAADRIGRVDWSVSLVDRASGPRGRAQLEARTLLVPTESDLLYIDVTTGAIRDRDLWAFAGAGGNMIRAGRRFAVIHAGGCLIYNDRDSERARVAALVGDPSRVALERSDFLLRSGSESEALAILEPWLATRPGPPEPNSPIDQLHLRVAEALSYLASRATDANFAARLANARVGVERRPARKVAACIDLASIYERAQQPAAALDALYMALDYDSPATEYTLGRGLRVPSEAFIRDRLRSLRNAHPPERFASIEQQAMAALEDSLRNRSDGVKTSISYLDIIRRFPFSEAARRSYIALAQHHADAKDWANAARYLLEYSRDFPTAPDAITNRVRAADLMYRSGKRSEAKRLFTAVRSESPGEPVGIVRGAEPGETVESYVERRLSDPGIVDATLAERPALRFPIRMAWRSPADLLAINRTFLEPEGDPPASYDSTFFTQSNEIIECRDLDTGLPRWTVHLRMVPGFYLERFVSEFYFARAGNKLIRGRYVGNLLVLYDHRNVFAVDLTIGKVRWHFPIGDSGDEADVLTTRKLSEQARSVRIADSGVFVVTSAPRLIALSVGTGELRFSRELEYQPATSDLLSSASEIFVTETRRARQTQRIFAYRIADGAPAGELQVGPAGARDTRWLPTGTSAMQIGERAVIPFEVGRDFELHLVDLSTRATLWSKRRSRNVLSALSWFPSHPDELIATINRENNWPALAGVSLDDGRELWRYEGFDARRLNISVFRDESMIYALFGSDQLRLLALRVREGQNRGRLDVVPQWAPEPDIALGTFFVSSRERRVLVSADAVIFPDSNSVSIYDRQTGQAMIDAQTAFSQFLVDKGNFTANVIGGMLIVLTDGGDCAFTARTAETAPDMLSLVRSYLEDSSNPDTVIALALGLFQQPEVEHVYAALELLDRTLMSEEFLAERSASDKRRIELLLDGLEEEAMKRLPPAQIETPRLHRAPVIDGELEDDWNYAFRIRLTSPRYIGQIARHGQDRDWKGDEDLSAILYAGWDDENFYFALDVDDDALRPFDRDAENWRGDCLIIGVDPEDDGGYRQGPTDQLMTLALTVPRRNQRDKDPDADDPENPADAGDDPQDEATPDEDDGAPDGRFSVKKKDDDSGAIYEVALPWSSFGSRFGARARPQPGVRFGLSLLLTDDDDGKGATKTLSINPCHLLPPSQKRILIWKYLIPEYFPRIVLR